MTCLEGVNKARIILDSLKKPTDDYEDAPIYQFVTASALKLEVWVGYCMQ